MNKCPFRFSDSEVSYVEDEIFRGEIDIKNYMYRSYVYILQQISKTLIQQGWI